MGDPTGPRTVCSGLVHHYTLDQMQGRRVVVVANLKPAKMRGVLSSAMVLCAADAAGEKVEFVNPPQGATPGDRLFFQGYHDVLQTQDQLPVLKKKAWSAIAEGLATDANGRVVFTDAEARNVGADAGADVSLLVDTSGEPCCVELLTNCQVR